MVTNALYINCSKITSSLRLLTTVCFLLRCKSLVFIVIEKISNTIKITSITKEMISVTKEMISVIKEIVSVAKKIVSFMTEFYPITKEKCFIMIESISFILKFQCIICSYRGRLFVPI